MAMQMRSFRRKTLKNTRTWHGSAFIMEALALLFFLAICMAILMQLLSFSYHRAQEAGALANAVTLASNEAEQFATNPTGVANVRYFSLIDEVLTPLDHEEEGCYVVTNGVSESRGNAGTMYRDLIRVAQKGETLYELETSHYSSNGGIR